MEHREIFLKFKTFLEPYYKAMTTASGLTDEEARLCVTYAIVTHLDFDRIPALVFRGALGTGKSEALEQLAKMCNEPKEIKSHTRASLRDALNNCKTAIIDEADNIDEALIRDRFAKSAGIVHYKKLIRRGIWQDMTAITFGASILTRRIPIADTALRSRCIIIETKNKEGDYHQTDIDNREFKQIVSMINLPNTVASDRVYETWEAVFAVAYAIRDTGLIVYFTEEMEKGKRNLNDNQEYDATAACLGALVGLATDSFGNTITEPKWIHLNEIRNAINEHFCLKLRVNQAAEIFTNEGFAVKTMRGFPAVRAMPDCVEAMVKNSGE